MSVHALAQYQNPEIIKSVYTGVGDNLNETTRFGTLTGFSTPRIGGVVRLQNQQVVDLTSNHLEYIKPEGGTLQTCPFNSSNTVAFNFRPEGKIRDISLHLTAKAASGKKIGLKTPYPFLIKRYFWHVGQSTFEESPMSNHYDALLLTMAAEFEGRKESWGYGNFFEREEYRHFHPKYQTLENSGPNADIDLLIPLNSFWVNKEFDPAGTNLPAFRLELTFEDASNFSDATAYTDIEVDNNHTYLMVRTERATHQRALATKNLFLTRRVHTRCILPQKLNVRGETYLVNSTMKFNIGSNLQGLLTGIIFHLSPTELKGSETAADEVWTVTDAATAGSLCAVGISYLGTTKPLAYNANAATVQAALDEIYPGYINSGCITVGTGFLSDGGSTITFTGGMGKMPHGSEGRNINTFLDVDANTSGTAVGYNKTTPGVRSSYAYMGIPIESVLLQVNGQPGVISSREIPRQMLLEYTKEGLLNPNAVIEEFDNAYYLLPFCKKFGESYATGRLYGVLPISNTNVELHIKTLPAAKLPTRFTYSGTWYLHATAYKVVEFVSLPAKNGTTNAVSLNFITPTTTV